MFLRVCVCVCVCKRTGRARQHQRAPTRDERALLKLVQAALIGRRDRAFNERRGTARAIAHRIGDGHGGRGVLGRSGREG